MHAGTAFRVNVRANEGRERVKPILHGAWCGNLFARASPFYTRMRMGIR